MRGLIGVAVSLSIAASSAASPGQDAIQGLEDDAAAVRLLATIWGVPEGQSPAAVLNAAEAYADVFLASPFRDDEFGQALERFDQALALAPPPEPVLLAMTDLMIESGLTRAGEAILEKVADAHPDWGATRIGLGESYAQAQRNADALEAFSQARRAFLAADLGPDARRARLADIDRRVGRILTDAGRLDEARAAYESSLDLEPDTPASRVELGLVLSLSNQPDSALAEYRRALALDPANPTALYRTAQANLTLGRLEEAVAAADRSLAIEPTRLESRFVRARALIRLGRLEEGRAELDRYRRLEAERHAGETQRMEALTQFDAAASKTREGRYEESIALYESAIAAEPDIVNLYFNYFDLGAVLSRLDRHAAAIGIFRAMLDLGFDDFRIRKGLAREYMSLGDTRTAERHDAASIQRLVSSIRRRLP